jgi:hypothetical protein
VHRVHGGIQVAPCGAVWPSARVRALRGQHEDLSVLPRARTAMGDGAGGVARTLALGAKHMATGGKSDVPQES